MALYGHELSTATNPYEAGLGRTVVLDKEFVGSASPATPLRSSNRSGRLVALAGAGRRAARAGYTILADGEPVGERDVGCAVADPGLPDRAGVRSTPPSPNPAPR